MVKNRKSHSIVVIVVHNKNSENSHITSLLYKIWAPPPKLMCVIIK